MYKRVFFGKIATTQVANLKDIAGLEVFVLALLAIPTIWFGVYPQPILQLSSAASTHIIQAAHAVAIG
jgi:NADH-quinone oxidoreductase subunit M